MAHNKETRGSWQSTRASDAEVLWRDKSEDTRSLTNLQAQRLVQRFGLRPTIASVIAELAYHYGSRA